MRGHQTRRALGLCQQKWERRRAPWERRLSPRARTPGRRGAGGYRCTLQLLWEPSPGRRRAAACASRSKGQCEGTERTHSQKSVALRDPSHPAGTCYPSESQHPPHGVWQPLSLQTAVPPWLWERQRHLLLPSVVLLQDHPKVEQREFNPALWDGQPRPGVLQLCEGLTSEKTAGPKEL